MQRGVSTTLLCGEAHGVLTEDYRIRRLTPVERERLQGYPDNWTAGLSEVQRFNRMGNSISTVIPEFIARNLILKENI